MIFEHMQLFQILLLDEPTAGMDSPSRKFILQILGEERENSTILHITHYIDELGPETDLIALLHKGELRYYGTMDTFSKQHGRY